MHIETQEVYQFTGAVYFSLESVFTLAQHSGRIHAKTVLCGQQVCSLQEY